MNFDAEKIIIFLNENPHLADTVKKYLDHMGMGRNLSVVSDVSDMQRVIGSGRVILTLADQDMGSENLINAIKIQHGSDSELPFILITKKEKQDESAKLLEQGAGDYITTDNLKRLAPVIKREIKAYNEVMAGKKARQEIKELLNIIESAEDEIYILDGETLKVKFANRKAKQNLGYTIEELNEIHIQDISEEMLSIELQKVENQQSRLMCCTRFVRKDGTKYPAEAVFQTAETNGKIAVIGIIHDITEKESVKQHAFVLNKAIDASASSVTVIDNDLKIIYVNKTQAKFAGRKISDMIGKDITEEKMYAKSGAELTDALADCKKGESWVGEYQKTGEDEEDYIVLGSISPVEGENGDITNIVIVEEDISERVRIKNQLLHAQKMETVGELTSGIAHDFTNMLTAIGGFASIMKRKMDKENRFYTYVEKISELTVRAKSLTKNLLTFSRKQMQAERVICVNSLVSSVGEFLSMVIGSRIELKLELMDEKINIIGDPVQLEQVIINLATNARDAIENDGILIISTDKTLVSDADAPGGLMEYAVISVKDNGCGIPKTKMDKIFEPFYTTKMEGKGTGLGLYIVSDIISRHRGSIECYSEEGIGTEFVIKFPATDRMPEEEKDESELSESTTDVTILLAEDEKTVRESLAHALDVYGYKIIEAVNGKEALDIFKERHNEIDMVITDIVMPVMNGVTAYREMAAIRPDIKIIFTTGYVGEAHRKDGFNEEEHVMMIKPLMIKDLVIKIEEMLKGC
jgi:PAS domain S-box-containing protein